LKFVSAINDIGCSCRGDTGGALPVDMRPLPKEPDADDRKKKTLKSKIRKGKGLENDKPNVSNPTNFEHILHVGFDPVTGEFTVSIFFTKYIAMRDVGE